MNAYTGLSVAYDALMREVDYSAWCAYYMRIAGLEKGMRVLEAACGSGLMTAELLKRGLNVIAGDLSEEMLSLAAEKARKAGKQAVFARMDMRALSVHKSVDAVLSVCDGVNYLTEGAGDFFKSAHACLAEGGVLAFDISSARKLESMDGQLYFDDGRERACFWTCAFDRAKKTLAMEVTLFVRQGGLYRRYDETHLQKAHEAGQIVEMLYAAGFSDITIYGDQTLGPPEPGEARLHFTAKK